MRTLFRELWQWWLAPPSTGRRGEKVAAQYLRQHGYKLLARNLRLKTGEIDLLCQAPDGRTIVIVEVKSGRRRPGTAPELRPETHVNFAKQRKLTHLAQELVQRWKLADRPVRFDVIGVDFPPEAPPPPESRLAPDSRLAPESRLAPGRLPGEARASSPTAQPAPPTAPIIRHHVAAFPAV